MLKSIHHTGGGVEVITFAFVLHRGEVIQDANTRGGEAHIVPELLALLRADMLDSLTFHEDIITDQEVHEMLVLDGLAMEKDGEVILTLEGYVRLMERDSQSFLIHILIEERTHVAMDDLAAADDVIGVGTELLGEMGVCRLELMYGIVGHVVGCWLYFNHYILSYRGVDILFGCFYRYHKRVWYAVGDITNLPILPPPCCWEYNYIATFRQLSRS